MSEDSSKSIVNYFWSLMPNTEKYLENIQTLNPSEIIFFPKILNFEFSWMVRLINDHNKEKKVSLITKILATSSDLTHSITSQDHDNLLQSLCADSEDFMTFRLLVILGKVYRDNDESEFYYKILKGQKSWRIMSLLSENFLD